MAGRNNKYDTHIKPFFKKIDEMLNDGATEKQVAESLGISYPSWNKYKVKYPELKELCEKPRTKLIDDLRGALVKRALGFEYEEKKQYITEDENGNKKKHTEITTKFALPDVAAINLALKNYDRDNWANDPQALEMKRQELQLRREMAELDKW